VAAGEAVGSASALLAPRPSLPVSQAGLPRLGPALNEAGQTALEIASLE